jgi:hypothetical protein
MAVSVRSQIDTSLRADSQTVITPAGLEYKPAKTPMLALGMSAVLPGAGQIYTENYWKVPIIWGVGGYWIYEWIQMNSDYRDFRDRYRQEATEQNLRLRDFYRDERDKFAWYLAALYAGAHLYDFDVSPDVALDGRITPKVTATIKIPL